MPTFQPGDRVVMTEAAIRDRLRRYPHRSEWKKRTRGIVVLVQDCTEDWWNDRLRIRVLSDGERKPRWYMARFWQLDPAAVVGTREYLEARAMCAAFRRD